MKGRGKGRVVLLIAFVWFFDYIIYILTMDIVLDLQW